jgi:hypothetical protein
MIIITITIIIILLLLLLLLLPIIIIITHLPTFPPGGAVYSSRPEGAVTARDCVFSGNAGAAGGGIRSLGPVTLERCAFANNRAHDGESQGRDDDLMIRFCEGIDALKVAKRLLSPAGYRCTISCMPPPTYPV